MNRPCLAIAIVSSLILVAGCGATAAKSAAPLQDATEAVDTPAPPEDAASDAQAAADLAAADTAVTDVAQADEDAGLLPDAVTEDAAPIADADVEDAQLADVTDAAIADVAIADVADAAAPEAWGCPYVDAKNYPYDAGDITAGFCFVGAPPAADAFVMDVPSPKDCPCPPDPPVQFFGAAPIPPATLVVELGAGDDSTGTFKPYADGDWVPIAHGPQGGIHVWAAFRVPLASKEAKVKIQTRANSTIGCSLAGTGNTAVAYAAPDAAVPGTYTNASLAMPGIQVVFPSWGSESSAYCGQWLELRMQIRDVASGAWGEVRRTVRLYDSQPMLGGGP